MQTMTPSQDPAPASRPAASQPLTDQFEDAVLAVAPATLIGLSLAAAASAAGVYALANPGTVAALSASLAGAEPKVYWYLSRASALVSYGLVWLSMVLGLALTNKLARVWPGGPTFAALHEHASLLGLVFGALHALTLLGDHYIGFTLAQVLVPFANLEYRPVWVAAGQIAFYLLLPVTFSFYIRRWIGVKLWRWIHALSFAAFALSLAHGVFSGTDSTSGGVLMAYWASFVAVAGLSMLRVITLLTRPVDLDMSAEKPL